MNNTNRGFKNLWFVFVLTLHGFVLFGRENLGLTSPSGEIKVDVVIGEKIYYTVAFNNNTVLAYSPLSITIDGKQLGIDPKLLRSSMEEIKNEIKPIWGSKNVIDDHYNRLLLDFQGGYSAEFRAYDNGVAYRFITNLKKDKVTVQDEEVAFRFGFGISAWLLNGQSYESNYLKIGLDAEKITDLESDQNKIFLPMVVQATPTVKVLITEANLYEYPSLFLDRGNDYENFLLGKFENYTLTTKTGGFSNYSQLADEAAEHLAVTDGNRDYPWRVMVISDDDRDFVDCDLVYQLSRPNVLEDTSWIKPGKVAWDWWHDYVVEGEKFIGGVNTETYLYHIDFADKYNLEYILIDWLWTDKYDLTLFNPEVDLKKIVDYATSKNVGVIVWAPGHTLHNQLDKALDLFESYGIVGVKADFFGREDQTGIRMYEDIAKATAKRKMLIDFHGCTKPTGLSRTYPNVINYEAVLGNEYNKLEDKASIDHKVMLPFTRGLQGPMDYTPGGMRNLQSGHSIRFNKPVVHGSRSGEMALFVIYNEPLKMMCDAPSVYEREPELTQFISKIPTAWDETLVIEAGFGKYVIEARRKGKEWYLAGLNGSIPKKGTIDLSFLGNQSYALNSVKDGPNSTKVGTDYLMETREANKGAAYTYEMVKGGGFIVHLAPLGND